MKAFVPIIAIFTLFACSPSSDNFFQIERSMPRSKVIEIMGQPTSTESRDGIECLTYDVNTPNQIAFYGVLIDIEKNQVIETFLSTESLEDSKRDRWQRYLAVKIDEIKNGRK